jgi:hypothetical protein
MATREDPIIATYVLKKPVDFAGVKTYQLEFRELVAADHLRVEKMREAGVMERTKEYLQLSCLTEPGIIERLSMPDFLAAGKIINDFLAHDFQPLTTMTSQ